MAALSTPFTVFRAVAALGVDDGAGVELITHEIPGDPMCCLVEYFLIGRGSQQEGFLKSWFATVYQSVFDRLNHIWERSRSFPVCIRDKSRKKLRQ